MLGGHSAEAYLPANVGYMYNTLFMGAAARLSDTQVRDVLEILNWPCAW